MEHTFNILAFSYFSLSLCPFQELLAARDTFLNLFGLIGSRHLANQVTVSSCVISAQLPMAHKSMISEYNNDFQFVVLIFFRDLLAKKLLNNDTFHQE
jgi:hypothetical protein